MKILLVGLLLSTYLAAAQEFHFQPTGTRSIELQFSNASLHVKGHTDSKISIIRNEFVEKEDERSSGLTKISAFPDNSGIGFYVAEEKDVVKLYRQDDAYADYTILVPHAMDLRIKEFKWYNGSIEVENISASLSITASNSEIKLRQLSGPSYVKSVSGNIDALSTSLPIDYQTVSGKVTLVLPAALPAELAVHTISGQIICDFATSKTIEVKGSTLTQVGRVKRLDMPINGGGKLLNLESVSGLIELITVSH